MNVTSLRAPWQRQRAPALLWVLGIALVMFLYLVEHDERRARLHLETQVTADQVQLRLEACMDNRAKLVKALASDRWTTLEEVRQDWVPRAESLFNVTQGLQALNFISDEGVIEIVYPVEPNLAALGQNLSDFRGAAVPLRLSDARESDAIKRTKPIQLMQSGRGFAFYLRLLSQNGAPLGFVSGVFRIDDFMESCLTESPLRDRFAFDLAELDGTPVFQQGLIASSESQAYLQQRQLNIPGNAWLLQFAPTQAYIKSESSYIAGFLAFVGVLLVTLLAVAFSVMQMRQRSLRTSEDKYRLLVENQSEMVVKLNPDRELVYVSPSYCRMLGRSESTLLGHEFAVNPGVVDTTSGQLVPIEAADYQEVKSETSNGWRWVGWTQTVVTDKAGEVLSIIAVGRDLTEIKQLEERINHAQKMQALGQMAGGITHDFNNMLHVILGNIEFLIEATQDQPLLQEDLNRVLHGVERAMSLTAKLSTLSRQKLVNRADVILNTLVDEAASLLLRTLPASITFNLQVTEEVIPVNADVSQIEQVILNICLNARDAIDGIGNIDVTVDKLLLDQAFCRYHPELTPGWYGRIDIRDTGSGMDADTLPRIFDPFFTTKSLGAGTGLGLANSYSIMKQHQGLILVESKLGFGTCFSLYLPVCEAPVVKSADLPHEVEQEPSGRRSQTILLVEDDPDIIKLSKRILEDAGYRCLTAADGQQAIDEFNIHGGHIDLVILDLVMPRVGGRAAAEAMIDKVADVKILFVSGFVPTTAATEITALEGPLLRKPYKKETLLARVKAILAD